VHEPTGPMHSLRARRTHLLEINGLVAEGRLKLDWTYSENVHRRTTIERLAHNFIEALRDLILHCTTREATVALVSEEPKPHNIEFVNSKKERDDVGKARKLLGFD
jgi:non-ribosomal peptide synthase protein (TIGR01720 family)